MKTLPNCKRCKTRETCTSPCPALRTDLAKVTKGGRELNIGVPFFNKVAWPDPANEGRKQHAEWIKSRRRDYILLTLVGLGFDRDTIAQVLGIPRKKLHILIFKAKQKFKIK